MPTRLAHFSGKQEAAGNERRRPFHPQMRRCTGSPHRSTPRSETHCSHHLRSGHYSAFDHAVAEAMNSADACVDLF